MKIHSFPVIPNLPPKLKALDEIAGNMLFSWNWDAVQLFLRLNPNLWFRSYQNPVMMLGSMPMAELEKAEKDTDFMARLKKTHSQLKEYFSVTPWFARKHNKAAQSPLIAYFSCEYGIGECLPIYSGGLGLLSGDHLKSASDLGVPLVAIGLLYQQGYFRQTLSHDGWQAEHYPANDWHNTPLSIAKSAGGPARIQVDAAGETVHVQIWKARVGRVDLFLLDTNVPENPPHHRAITSQLYGGDRDMRIRQEIVLGIGGVRALAVLGLTPTVYHMNEGHSAFLALERIRNLMATRRLNYHEAREIVWASNIFTTHTPVPAGNEQFDFDLVQRYFTRLHEEIGISWGEFAALGQEVPGQSHKFNMTVMALKMAAHSNAVAKLHGVVSRRMWQGLWPGLPETEIPIASITNGVHTRSWLSHELWELMARHLGKGFSENPADEKSWAKVNQIPDDELWSVRQIRGEKLVNFARFRIREQMKRRGADATELRRADGLLNPDTLTIGFARRFATYKRGDLIFRDADRLHRILSDQARPVQIVFAGKAHPQDTPGKEVIKRIVNFAKNDSRFIGRVVFIEDYDINVARYMVQGVDVWLNNPRRPLEASGTSGMKAAVNGTLNLSFLDGWWDEAYTPEAGWAIGEAGGYENEDEQDRIEAQAIYNLLERDITPKFYDRDKKGLPKKWIAMMKASIQKLGSQFNTHRMVAEYTERFYLPAHHAGLKLDSDGAKAARALANWRRKIEAAWPGVEVRTETAPFDREIKAGDRVPIAVAARLGQLGPDDVSVEIHHGELDGDGRIVNGETVRMEKDGRRGDACVFKTEILCRTSGRYGFAARVMPRHPDLVHHLTPFHITWEKE